MKLKLLCLLLAASTLLTLTACDEKAKTPPMYSSSAPETSNPNSGSTETSFSNEIVPEFQKFVGEWKTLDADDVPSITMNPNMTMTYNGKTVALKQITPTEYTLSESIEFEDFTDKLSTDRLNFQLNQIGLYELNFNVQRSYGGIGYTKSYFCMKDYQIVELNSENVSDYVDFEFFSKCERGFGDEYTVKSGVDLDLECDYILDLEFTYKGKNISRPVTFQKGRKPILGDIVSSVESTETIKAPHPFSNSYSYANGRSIKFNSEKYSVWSTATTVDDVKFIEVEEVVSVSGKALIAKKLPASDPNHVHFYDSEPCSDGEGNTWKECECGEKSFVTKSDKN